MKALIACLFLCVATARASIIVRKTYPPIPPADIDIRLSVEPESGLPSIPPTLRIEVRNNGNTAALFPVYTNLHVERSHREPFSFFAYTEGRGEAIGEVLENATEGLAVRLGPKETRTYTIWSGPETPRWFVFDTRLWSAGAYTLQIIVPGPPRYESNKVTYTVTQPTGADAAVWELIKEAHQSGLGIAEVIARNHGASAYAPYYVPDGTNRDDQIRNLELALERGGVPPRWRDNRKLALGQHSNSKAYHLLKREKNPDAAIAAAERARDVLGDLSKTAVDSRDREEAQKLLKSTWNRQAILEEWGVMNGVYPDRITGEAQCIETTADGKTLLWWGYNNSTSAAIDLAVGEKNKFTPAPHDRGQPTHFSRGYQWQAFSIPLGKENSFTWHLYHDPVHVKIEDVPRCESLVYRP